MKKNDVLEKLNSTKLLAIPNEVVVGVGRELDMSELGLVVGGQMIITVSFSKSGGDHGNDDCLD